MKKVVLTAILASFILTSPAFADDTIENYMKADRDTAGALSSSAPANEVPMLEGVEKTREQLKADGEFVELAIREKGGRAEAAGHMAKRGWEACDANDFPTAVKRFNQAWLIDPDNAKIYHGFGVWAGKQNKIGDAVRYLVKAVELCGTDPAILNDLGFAYNICAQMSQDKPEQKKKYLADACGVFEKAGELGGVKDILFENWASSLYQLGDYEKALEKLEIQKKMGGKVSQKLIDHIKGLIDKNEKMTPPKHSEAQARDVNYYLKSGAGYYYKGEYDKAIADFSKTIELDPQDYSAYCNRGSAYERKDDCVKALRDYDKAAELNPKDPIIYFNRGLIHERNGELDRAIDDLNKAIELNPKYFFAYNRRGAAYYNKGDYEKAAGDLSKTIESGFADAITYYNRGLAYKKLGEKDKAVSDHNKAAELDQEKTLKDKTAGDPDKAIAPEREPFNMMARGNRGQADKKASSAPAQSQDPVFYFNRGLAYNDKGEYGKAIGDYDKVIELSPELPDAYCARGMAYCGRAMKQMNRAEIEKALSDYDKAIKLDPAFTEAYLMRGLAHKLSGKYDKALADYNKALELDPANASAKDSIKQLQDERASAPPEGKNPAFYCERGSAYLNGGEVDKALADFNKAVELNPGLALAYCNRGSVYISKNEYDKALSDLNKAIELVPDFSMAYNNRGMVYKKRGEYEKALSDYNKAIELDHENVVFYNNRAQAYEEKGEYDKSISDSNKALELSPKNSMAYNNRGLAYFKKGMYEDAVSDCKKAVELDPNNIVARNNLKFIQDKKTSSQK